MNTMDQGGLTFGESSGIGARARPANHSKLCWVRAWGRVSRGAPVSAEVKVERALALLQDPDECTCAPGSAHAKMLREMKR